MDLYLVQLVDEIPVHSIENIPASGDIPRKLKVMGRDFTHALEVRVNNLLVRDFELKNPTTMIVTLPDVLQLADIYSVQVLSDAPHDKKRSTIKIFMGEGFYVSGIQYLVQQLVKWLLTTPGTDAFYPQEGGGWRSVAGFLGTKDDPAPLLAVLSDGLQRTVGFIQELQANDLSLLPEERLVSAEITNAVKRSDGLHLEVRLETAAGSDFLLALRLGK